MRCRYWNNKFVPVSLVSKFGTAGFRAVSTECLGYCCRKLILSQWQGVFLLCYSVSGSGREKIILCPWPLSPKIWRNWYLLVWLIALAGTSFLTPLVHEPVSAGFDYPSMQQVTLKTIKHHTTDTPAYFVLLEIFQKLDSVQSEALMISIKWSPNCLLKSQRQFELCLKTLITLNSEFSCSQNVFSSHKQVPVCTEISPYTMIS